MSSLTPKLIEQCPQCGYVLAPGTLACDKCLALVYGEELERQATSAKELEAKGQLRAAREQWLQALPLLPPDAQQADWIRAHARELLDSALSREIPDTDNKWARRLGPAGPVAVLLAKSKALLAAVFKLKFLLGIVTFVWFYSLLFGFKFGAGLAALILVHELGHYIDIKRRGLPVNMPVFLPGLGAYVRWNAMGVPMETRAAISLAGPLAGWIASAICGLLWLKTGNTMWAALARAGAWLNVVNLIPVWILDGNRPATAMSRTGRMCILTAALILWLVLGESVFFLVAAGALWRLFTKDMPAQASLKTTTYYLALLGALGLVLHLMPGHGFGWQ